MNYNVDNQWARIDVIVSKCSNGRIKRLGEYWRQDVLGDVGVNNQMGRMSYHPNMAAINKGTNMALNKREHIYIHYNI